MQRETFIIGSREFAASKIAPFEANSIIMKLQKLILPVLGEMVGDKTKPANIMDMDISSALNILSERLDDKTMTDIILPMFKLSQVACLTDNGETINVKIDSPASINKVFVDADNLAELYELAFEVLKFNFASFFAKVAERFGGSVGNPPAPVSTSAALVR